MMRGLADMLRAVPDHIKHVIDGISVAATLAALVQWLPALASLVTIVWTAIRIWETRTVQGLLGRAVRTEGSDDD